MSTLLLASVLFPPLLALIGLIPRLVRIFSLFAPWASLPALLFALIDGSASTQIDLPSVLFGTQLGMDEVGRVFLLLTALLWLASGLSTSYSATPHWDRKFYSFRRYWFFHLLTLTGNLGVTLSQDAGSFYTFFALMTFGGFGLISHDQSLLSRTAGCVYLSLAVVGEMFILSGLVLASHAANSVDLQCITAAMESSSLRTVIVALIFAGFGVKVGLVPFHVWLPLSYSAAPVPAAAVLSGAMTKAGILGWIRFIPLGLLFSENWALIIIFSGILMAFYGVLLGLTQTQTKTALAYSSLSQMGYLTIAIGTALEPGAHSMRSIVACMAYAIHHGIAKSALFLGVAVVTNTVRASLARNLVLILLLWVSLSLVGVPFTGGAFVKTMLKESGSQDGLWQRISGIAMLAGSVATALLAARFMILYSRIPHDQSKPNFSLILPWIILSLLSVLSPLIISNWLSSFESDLFVGLIQKVSSGSTLTWVITILIIIISRPIWARQGNLHAIPPGDILIPIQYCTRRFYTTVGSFFNSFTSDATIWRDRVSTWTIQRGVRTFTELEKLRTRGYAGVGMLLLVWAAFWLLLIGGDE